MKQELCADRLWLEHELGPPPDDGLPDYDPWDNSDIGLGDQETLALEGYLDYRKDKFRNNVKDQYSEELWQKILDRLGIKYKNRANGSKTMLCLIHQEKTPSLRVWPSGNFMCHGCNQEGDIADFIFWMKPHLLKGILDDVFDLSEDLKQELLSYHDRVSTIDPSAIYTPHYSQPHLPSLTPGEDGDEPPPF